MGAREKDVQERGIGKALVESGLNSTGIASEIRNSIESLEAPESMPVKDAPVAAFVDGKRVSKLYVLLRHPMFLITEGFGTHETSRIYCTPDECRIGDRFKGQLGPAKVSQVSFDRRSGVTVVTNLGTMFSPLQDCQVTWVVE